MMVSKKRITVDLEAEEYNELLKLKSHFDRPIAWLGRKAVCEFLEKHHLSSNQKSQFSAEMLELEGRVG